MIDLQPGQFAVVKQWADFRVVEIVKTTEKTATFRKWGDRTGRVDRAQVVAAFDDRERAEACADALGKVRNTIEFRVRRDTMNAAYEAARQQYEAGKTALAADVEAAEGEVARLFVEGLAK